MRSRSRLRSLPLLLLALSASARAAGPEDIAIADQSLWPDAIQSRAAYDAASRSELLVFLRAYGAAADTPVPGGNEESLRAWRSRSERFWLRAYRDASRTCARGGLGCGFHGATFPELLAFAGAFNFPDRYAPWLAMSEKFFSIYVAEQKRLAALFPKPTSEILPVAPSERMGDEMRDGQFLLTFDDGPTPAGGNTDGTLRTLEAAGLRAQFFALGGALQGRIGTSSPGDVARLYGRQCLGSHGFEHKSHQTWDGWKASLDNTFALIQKLFPGSRIPFRPPYGQRTAEVVAEQERLAQAPVVLWNIDSEDWNPKMPIEKVGDRVQKLMLVWRRGIILMHDVHPKAQVAIPQLARFAAGAALSWMDCRELR